MILTDTTIVVEFLRTADARIRNLIVTNQAAVCGVTRAEVLHGARDAKHRVHLVRALGLFQQVVIPDDHWDLIGDQLAHWRSSGLTVPFADAVIATVAVLNYLELWTRDAHFSRIQAVTPKLRLFQEPP